MAASSDDRSNERSGGGGDEAEAEEKTDGWLTTYADMVTLLLTFFVLLVAMSATDNKNVEMFLLAISSDGITAEQFWEIQEKYETLAEDQDTWDDSFPLPEDSSGIDEDQGGNAALLALSERMAEYISGESLGDIMDVVYNGDFLIITLRSDILFETARTQVTDEMKESALQIAAMLAETFEPDDPFEIVVAGHTDNVPINTVEYPSNWHISSDRAKNFLWELIRNSGLDAGFFSSRAYGEFSPIATNDTEEGRAKNRRVEVMVSLARRNPLWDSYYHVDNTEFPIDVTVPAQE